MRKHVLQVRQLQAEKLTELGVRLCEGRKLLGMSLDEVASKTHIQQRLLRAIEAGKMEELPEPVYIQSFIRQYANAIGLNGVHLAGEFPLTFKPTPTRSLWMGMPTAQLRPVHLYAFYMVLVVVAVQGLSSLLSRSAASQPQLSLESLQKFKESLPVSNAPMGPNAEQMGKPTAVSLPGANGKPVRVGLTFTDQSWVRIVVDGKEEYEGVLPQGTMKTWAADRQVVVRAGNAGGIMVVFNESQAKPLGEPGSVQEVAFPPDPRVATLNPEAIDLLPLQ
jgi:Helix-turn-helix domain/Domain of unknown function (DUF4115)